MIKLHKDNDGYSLSASEDGVKYIFADNMVSGIELVDDFVCWKLNGKRYEMQFIVTGSVITYTNVREVFTYNVDVGDRVCHRRDETLVGVVVAVDRNLPDVTTCSVMWDDSCEGDVVWTNKLLLIDGE